MGAGVIGLCSALSLADRGAAVTLIERAEPGRGASWAAAGMLAPAFEAAVEPGAHPRLFDLCIAGAEMWRAFAPRLQALTGRTLDYGDPGAIACAATEEQGAHLMAVANACEAMGLPHTRLEAEDARRLEPSLSPDLLGALELPTDQQVDNWAVLEGLAVALKRAGVSIITGTEVAAIEGAAGDFHLDAAPNQTFDVIIWTVGESARKPVHYEGEPMNLLGRETILPVKGQMFSLAPGAAGPGRVLRFGSGYIAPKSTRIVVGSTSEWGVDDTHAELDIINQLRRQAAQVCPVLGAGEITHIWAGVRPGTRHHGPVIGGTPLPGVFQATGHYRNGILLAPITAELIADLVLEGRRSELLDAFDPMIGGL